MAVLRAKIYVVLKAYDVEAIRAYTDEAEATRALAALQAVRSENDSFALAECELVIGEFIEADLDMVADAFRTT